MTRRAYIVDDDLANSAVLASYAEHAGFAVKMFRSIRQFRAAAADLAPGVVIVELDLPDGNGLSIIKHIRDNALALTAIGMSATGGVAAAVEAMRAGAFHFLEKPIQMAALTAVLHDGFLSLSQAVETLQRRQLARSMVNALTPRQRQILHGMVAGLRNEDIAREMGLTRRTVETYRGRLLERLKVESSIQAIKLAIDGGLED